MSIFDTHQIERAVKLLEMKGLRLFAATKTGISSDPLSFECSSAVPQTWRTVECLKFQHLDQIKGSKCLKIGLPLLSERASDVRHFGGLRIALETKAIGCFQGYKTGTFGEYHLSTACDRTRGRNAPTDA